ncbi:MAG: hypothetical protein H6625_12125 [Bdellovibrionaceae bacterium]|nr:hypothetical protein [Pseudobdellovibrionaceae bacterium]
MAKVIFSLLILCSNLGVAAPKLATSIEAEKSVPKKVVFGHNLSPTTHLMEKGEWTVGFYSLAYGVNDKLTLAISPWIYFWYNADNIFARYQLFENAKWKLGGQSGYFNTKSNSLRFKTYTMEVWMQNLTLSTQFKNKNFIHFNVNYMYFGDETKPFSLRREPLNNDPDQWTATTLMEAYITDNFGMLGELGVLGLNYTYPQVIMGASLFVKRINWYFQFGFSVTSTPGALFSLGGAVDNNEAVGVSGTKIRYPSQQNALVKYDRSLHPEVQFQYFF